MKISENKLESLLFNSIIEGDVAVCLTDVKTKMPIYASPACKKFFGLDQDSSIPELMQEWFEKIIYPEDVAEQRRLFESTMPLPKSRKYRRVTEDKQIQWIRVDTSNVIEAFGKQIQASFPKND